MPDSDDKNKAKTDDQNKDQKKAGDDKPPAEPPKKAADNGDGGGGVDDKAQLKKLADLQKRAESAEAKLEKLEAEKMKKDGDLQGLLDKQAKKNEQLSEALRDLKVKTLKHKLSSEFAKHAPDAHNVDLLLKLDEVKKAVDMDHDTLEISGVKDAVNIAKKKHPYMFKTQNAGWGGTTPIDNSNGKVDNSDVGAFFNAMQKAKTPQEKNRVRRQFGREL